MAEDPNTGVRVLWVVIIVLALAVFFQVGRGLTGKRQNVVAQARSGEITVGEAIALATRRPRAVRGYVVVRQHFPPELCTGLVRETPPRCLGPSMTIVGLDLNRLELRRGKDGKVEVGWTESPVAILGDLNTSTITVRQILN